VVAPPIIDRSERIRSGKNFPNPQKIPAPGLQRATHQIVFTRPRELLGGTFLAMLMFHHLCGTVGSQLAQKGGVEARVFQQM
jgi:hypothetical protein